MLGGIIIALILVVAFPVLVMMGTAILASILAITTNRSFNSQHAGTELLEVATADPYHRT